MRYFLYLLPLFFLQACSPPERNAYSGYVEGEYIYVSPTTGGVLETLNVERGDMVKEGDALFNLDATDLEASLAAAKAEAEQAQANLIDLTKGQRPEEIAVIQKQKQQAQANLANAQKEFNRAVRLYKVGGLSKAEYDARKAAFESGKARVQEISAQEVTATLGAREDRIQAAEANLAMMKQRVLQQEKRLAESAPFASVNAYVEDTYFRPGEFVGAGMPVVSLLPPENVKIRFFVPQEILPVIRRNQQITVNCDGCVQPLSAKITFIASQAEFTPPVIYSIESRDKLVFMIEAVPDQTDEILKPGLPVDIALGEK